ncbi:MAG: SDR family oxidoreductase, partial [Thermoguttaceae bacterium]|nr:SDR family oxidoreductase [Thermoguttaceae bacterium]
MQKAEDRVQNPECRAVVVTGASTGIGKACALELDRRGYWIFAGVRSEEAAQRLRAEGSPRLATLRLDVTDAESIAAAAAEVAEKVGGVGLAGLVNNAGICVAGPLEFVPLAELRRQFEVNVIGAMAMTQAMLPPLRTAGGRIVNISSISGRVAAPYLGPYAASKYALEALSDALRSELRRWGIRVSLVEPGTVDTPIWQKSRAASDVLAEQMRPEQYALYAQDIEALHRSTDEMARRAMPVDKVVRAVTHALTSRRPRTRYPVGLDAR